MLPLDGEIEVEGTNSFNFDMLAVGVDGLERDCGEDVVVTAEGKEAVIRKDGTMLEKYQEPLVSMVVMLSYIR